MPLFVLGPALEGHHADHLHLPLQDEESVVVQVNALGAEEFGHPLEGGVAPVDLVLAGVVPPGDAADDHPAPLHDVVVLVAVAGVHDLVEVDVDPRVLERVVLGGVAAVDQLRHLVEPQLLGALAEDEERGVPWRWRWRWTSARCREDDGGWGEASSTLRRSL